MRLNIRFQLLVPLLALMFGVVGMSTWIAMASAGRARRQIENQMDQIAGTVSAATFPRNQQILNLMKKLSGAEFILCDSYRQPLLDDAKRPVATLAVVPGELPGAGKAGVHPLGHRVTVGGEVYFTRGVPLGDEASANLYLYILYPDSLWRDAVWQALWPGLFLGVVGGVVSIVLTVAVTQRLARRIQELERRTRLIAGGDFSAMSLPQRDDELRDLGHSVNDMAGRLARFQEAAVKTERLRLLGQVSGGLAHQLRNGATGARLAVQLHARECSGSDPEPLTVALRQLALVESQLKRFLDVGAALELRRQRCDVNELVRETVSLLGPRCRHAGIELRQQDSAGPLVLSGDAGQLGQLFLNILSNAIEAAGPGGTVDVTVGRTASGNAFADIVDSGPGPAPEVAARLFEPFLSGKPEGVGLGLPVARQVAEAHGGSINWSRISERTSFRIELPLASNRPPP